MVFRVIFQLSQRKEARLNSRTLETVENWSKMPHDNVWVDGRKLREDCYLAVQRGRDFVLPGWDEKGVHPQSREAFMNFIFWVNVLNYDFSHPGAVTDRRTGERKRAIVKFMARDCYGKEQRGAYALRAVLYKRFGEEPILAKHVLPYVSSLSKTKKFLAGFNSLPLLHERRLMLLEACGILKEYFDGDPRNIFEKGRYRAFGAADKPGIHDILAGYFPGVFGSDVHVFRLGGGRLKERKLDFNFFKRANLLLVMYHDRAVKSGGALTPIEDIGEVGPIPDYELPRSYEADGIFRYGDELNAMIDNAKPIQRGSQMELEIRGATVWAQVWELYWLNIFRMEKSLPPLHIGHVDFYRWLKGKQIAKRNHHICFTTDY